MCYLVGHRQLHWEDGACEGILYEGRWWLWVQEEALLCTVGLIALWTSRWTWHFCFISRGSWVQIHVFQRIFLRIAAFLCVTPSITVNNCQVLGVGNLLTEFSYAKILLEVLQKLSSCSALKTASRISSMLVAICGTRRVTILSWRRGQTVFRKCFPVFQITVPHTGSSFLCHWRHIILEIDGVVKQHSMSSHLRRFPGLSSSLLFILNYCKLPSVTLTGDACPTVPCFLVKPLLRILRRY